MDFEAEFCDAVLKPSIIIPMNQEQPKEDLTTAWTNVHDVNTSVRHLVVTAEEDGEVLTVFVEGTVEGINSLQYIGNIYGEAITAEENDDRLIMKIPQQVFNWVLSEMKMMTGMKMKIVKETVILEQELNRQNRVNEKIPFSFTLLYKLA